MPNQKITYLLPLLTGTVAGRLASVGSLLQIPFAIGLAAKAYLIFPDDASITLAGLVLLHLCAAASALACWFYYGVVLKTDGSKFLFVLIVLVAVMPLIITFGTLRDG